MSNSSSTSSMSSSLSSFTASHQTYIYSLDVSTTATTSATESTSHALASTSSGSESTWMTSTECCWTDDNATNQSFVTLIPPLDPYWDRIPFAHTYWHQFDIKNIPAGYHYAIAIWMTFFGILGTLGNLLVIWVFCRPVSFMLLLNHSPVCSFIHSFIR